MIFQFGSFCIKPKRKRKVAGFELINAIYSKYELMN